VDPLSIARRIDMPLSLKQGDSFRKTLLSDPTNSATPILRNRDFLGNISNKTWKK